MLDADGSWHTAANWSSNPALPGAADDVTISVGGANVRTVTYSSSATTSIRSLYSDEALLLSGGRLRLTAGPSQAAGPFTMTGGTFEVAGKVDAGDLDTLVLNILDSEYGDANLDGGVDRGDAVVVAAHFGSTSAGWAGGDFTCDGQVSLDDVAFLQARLGLGASVPSAHTASSAVPEPRTIALAIVGACLACISRRRVGR